MSNPLLHCEEDEGTGKDGATYRCWTLPYVLTATKGETGICNNQRHIIKMFAVAFRAGELFKQ